MPELRHPVPGGGGTVKDVPIIRQEDGTIFRPAAKVRLVGANPREWVISLQCGHEKRFIMKARPYSYWYRCEQCEGSSVEVAQ